MGKLAVQPKRAPNHVTATGYYGGKARISKWTASLLPYDPAGIYCETHCGMGSVILCRRPCKVEIFNDLDERIIDWWRCSRDHHARVHAPIDKHPAFP